MKLLFLDIDGVLNDHEVHYAAESCTIERSSVDVLNHILSEAGAHYVLSSAWRYLIHRGEMNLIGLDWMLRSHGIIANRLHGVTRRDTMVNGKPLPRERGAQISEYLRVTQCTRHVVLDDMELGFEGLNFVKVSELGYQHFDPIMRYLR